MLTPTIRLQSLSVEADKLVKRVDDGVRRAMLRQAFQIRSAAVKSIKRAPSGKTRTAKTTRKKDRRFKSRNSKPGEPPKYHRNRFFPSRIFFAYDSATKSAVIGPAKVTNTKIPAALEKGGIATVNQGANGKRQVIKKRPYMLPAHVKLLPGYVLNFRGAITP